MNKLKALLKLLLDYNKAFTGLLGVPLVYFLVQNLFAVLASYDVNLPVTVDQVNTWLLWLIGAVVGVGVAAMPNGRLPKVGDLRFWRK